MPDNANRIQQQRAGHGRRRFLMGTAVLATPLAAGLVGCTSDAKASAAVRAPTPAGREESTATTATTLASRRKLGSLEVSSVGLGCQTMPGNLYGPVSSREDMITIIRTAADQGVPLFDTVEAYGPFESERIVGEALEPVRDQVVIASKFGFDVDLVTGQSVRSTALFHFRW